MDNPDGTQVFATRDLGVATFLFYLGNPPDIKVVVDKTVCFEWPATREVIAAASAHARGMALCEPEKLDMARRKLRARMDEAVGFQTKPKPWLRVK